MLAPFPANYMLRDVQFDLVGRGRTGGVGLSGAVTRVASNNAHWRATVSFVVHGEADFLAWQAFIAQMQGVVGQTLVPVWPRITPKDARGNDLARDDFIRVGQVQIAQPPIQHARLQTQAAARDTIISVKYVDTTGIFAGHRVSIGNHCYDVLSSWEENGTRKLLIDPPMRTTHDNSTDVVLDRPKCLMRFATESEGQMPHTTSPRGLVTCNFIEVFDGY